jgi:hypothetical protein
MIESGARLTKMLMTLVFKVANFFKANLKVAYFCYVAKKYQNKLKTKKPKNKKKIVEKIKKNHSIHYGYKKL